MLASTSFTCGRSYHQHLFGFFRPALAIIALAGSAGCESPSPNKPVLDPIPLPSTPASLQVEVGIGEGVFEPITADTVVDAVYGPQGGYHVWTAAKLTGTKLSSAQINVSARLAPDGAKLGRPSRVITDFRTTTDGAQVHAGITNFVDDPSALSGKRIVLRVEMIAPDGQHGEDERTVRVR